MTAALQGVRDQQHAPAALYARERLDTHFTGGWVGPRASLDGRKILSPPGFDPGTFFRSYTLYIYCIYKHTRIHIYIYTHTYAYIYRVSQEECASLRESVPYVKVYRYNPKHLYPKLNGYGDNGQRSMKL